MGLRSLLLLVAAVPLCVRAAATGGKAAATLNTEPVITSRVKLAALSLGPGPFPKNPDHMEFELFGSAKRERGHIELTDASRSKMGAIWSKKALPNQMPMKTDLKVLNTLPWRAWPPAAACP
jgi:hypothetical protein